MTDKEKDTAPETGEPAEQISAESEDLAGGGIPVAGEEEEDELSRVKSQIAYLAAEFDNYRKRVAREKEAIVSFGNERILRSILPFLDNLERAMSQSEATGSAEAILSGVRMTYEQILAELRKFGLEQIASVGEPFDPTRHEGIAMVPWEGKPDGTVLAESRKGYLLNGRLLRPAQVTVVQGVPAPEPAARENGNGPERFGQGN